MKAYVELIQRKERDLGCDVLTHQKVCTNVPNYLHIQSLSFP
jgi:isocitrate lyase